MFQRTPNEGANSPDPSALASDSVTYLDHCHECYGRLRPV
jgi:hypothetical protein